MITLWLVRHGQTDWNAQKRYQGHSDIPLNATGEAQAQQIAERLVSERLHAIISSDLRRTVQTADAIAAHHNLDIQLEPRLRESNFGVFEGLRYKDVIDQHKLMAEAWFADPENPPEGGEKLSEVAARVSVAIATLIAQFASNKRLVLIGHGGALRLLLCHLLEMPSNQYWRFNLDPCSLTRVNVYPGGAILVRLNDVSHLEIT
jgi:alpha-ribazole phosphatase